MNLAAGVVLLLGLACGQAHAGGPRAAQAPSLDSFLKGKRSWSLIAEGFSQIFPLNLKEVEGALPNRFFEKSLVSAGEGLDPEGHFVTVLCGDPGSYSPCPGKRAAMEERVISVALLRALPLGESEDRLFNGKTWELEPLGRQALKKVERRFPDLWARLFVLVARALKR